MENRDKIKWWVSINWKIFDDTILYVYLVASLDMDMENNKGRLQFSDFGATHYRRFMNRLNEILLINDWTKEINFIRCAPHTHTHTLKLIFIDDKHSHHNHFAKTSINHIFFFFRLNFIHFLVHKTYKGQTKICEHIDCQVWWITSYFFLPFSIWSKLSLVVTTRKEK